MQSSDATEDLGQSSTSSTHHGSKHTHQDPETSLYQDSIIPVEVTHQSDNNHKPADSEMPCMERNPWVSTSFPSLQPDDDDVMIQGDTNDSQALVNLNETLSVASHPNSPAEYAPGATHLLLPFETARKYTPKDVKDPHNAERGVCGLKNLGNTCFMNSGLQCLLCNPSIVRHLLEVYRDDTDLSADSTLTGQFAQLLKKVWSGEFTILHPNSFKQTLGFYHSQFEDFRQHDCQEFLALLLDSLHEQLNQLKINASGYDQSQSSIDLMGGAYNKSLTGDAGLGISEVLNKVRMDLIKSVPSTSDESDESAHNSDSQSPTRVTNMTSPTGNNHQLIANQELTSALKPIATGLDCVNINDERKLPTIEDLYMKDTKTLNTNVLVAEFDDEVIEVDSRKYHKQVNTDQQHLVDLGDPGESLSALRDMDETSLNALVHKGDLVSDEGSKVKVIKDTNFLSNQREKFSGEENCGGKKMFSEVLDADADEGDINRIKRIKIDESYSDTAVALTCAHAQPADKNLRMQMLLKINTDKNSLFDNGARSSSGYGSADTGSAPMDHSGGGSGSDTGCSVTLNNACASSGHVMMNNTCAVAAGGSNVAMSGDCSQIMNNARPKSELSPRTTFCAHNDTQTTVTSEGDVMTTSGSSSITTTTSTQDNPIGFNNEQHMMAKYMQEADREWSKYTTRNRSVIVDTFQGQFKSTVVCSECYHISVTFEPFMYLSVPIPHAMDKQIVVIYVSCDSKQPIKCLVTLNKQGTVHQLKMALRRLIGEESCDIIIAEVFNRHVSRLLDDNTLLRYINDCYRTVYAFEMLPAPSVEQTPTIPSSTDTTSGVTSTVTNPEQADDNNSVVTSLGDDTSRHGVESAVTQTGSGRDTPDVLNNAASVVSSSAADIGTGSAHAPLENRSDVDWQTNLLSDAPYGCAVEASTSAAGEESMDCSQAGDENKEEIEGTVLSE